jgi:hypothetical protein
MASASSALSQPRSDDAQASAGDETWLREMMVDELKDLTRLAKIGMEIAEAVGLQARADLSDDARSGTDSEGAPAAPLRAFDLVFGRVSRAVRLTYARRAMTIENFRRFNDDRKAAAETVEARRRREASLRRIVEGVALERDLDDADGVDGEVAEREVGERDVAEACERLSEDEQFGDLLQRPLSEAVAEVCGLLGLSPDWRRLAGKPWARQEMASSLVGEPLAAVKAEDDARPTTLIRVQLVEPPPRPPGPPFAESPPDSPSAWPPPSPDPISTWPPADLAAPLPSEAVGQPGEWPPPSRPRARPSWR